jgi:hypothetical protein
MPDEGPYSLYEARLFAEKYAKAKSEKQLGQSFWRDFFTGVCRVGDLLAAGIEFEYPVKSVTTQNTNFIDVLWPNVLLIEHKSAGKSLDAAATQARDYLESLDHSLRPPVFIVSDFANIRIVEVFANRSIEFLLSELPANIQRIEAILGKYTKGVARAEITADVRAASLMSNLFVEFENAGYQGHEVSVFLVRILFLLFGDDTRMWRRGEYGLFEEIIRASAVNGNGLGGAIQEVFQVLNTPKEKRPTTLDRSLVDFPYVNGGLFEEVLPIFSFTPKMRAALLDANLYNWSKISPAIFGAMFQTIKSKEDRKELGEHYTSESDILKVIGPLFLSDFVERLRKAWDSVGDLKRFRKELGTYNFLDPACGCGNFLLVAYKRMREIELKIVARLQQLENTEGQVGLEGSIGLQVHLSQFHGIEYEEWSSQIANVAMFLADHQANLAMEEITGAAPNRFPLTESAKIIHGNALQTDWAQVCPMNENTRIMSNPPFGGARIINPEQKSDTLATWQNCAGSGDLDYVTNWYLVAARHIANSEARAAFVSTNSITQGTQPAVIWGQLYQLNIGIDFAHRTFSWDNGASGKAAVHVVIIGFSNRDKPAKLPLWTYRTPKSAPVLTWAKNINAYLLDAPNILITTRARPLLPQTQPMDFGSMPNDGGWLSNISAQQAEEIRENDPIAAKYLRRLIGAQELIHNDERYCLWLVDANPADVRTSRVLSERVKAVRDVRAESKRAATRKLADRPTLFGEIRQPRTPYIAVPLVSSEERDYVPIALFSEDTITNNLVGVVPDGSLTTFGWLSSRVFNVWNKAISGRLKNDTRISSTFTYNNFPIPFAGFGKGEEKVAHAAEMVLNARAAHPTSSLADLYDRNAMPEQLRRAHELLDKEVLAILGLSSDASDEQILSVLFEWYRRYTENLPPDEPALAGRRAA